MPSTHHNASWNPAFRPNSSADLPATKDEDRSSWHPAFMPNFAADSLNKGELQEEALAKSPEIVSLVEESEADQETSGATHQEHENGSTSEQQSSAQDNAEYLELDRTQSDVNRTAAIQDEADKGVESTQSAPNSPSRDEDNVHEPHPTERTSPEIGSSSKHMSNVSFARTVGQDVDWEDDDKVDSEWNLSSKDADLFESMPKTHHTNSFPPVPPAHQPSSEVLHNERSHKQKGQAPSGHDSLFGDEEDGDKFFNEIKPAEENSNWDLEDHPQRGSYEQEISTERTDVNGAFAADPDDTARFEEGVPLVRDENADASVHNEQAPPSPRIDLFAEGDENDDDFFAQIEHAAEETSLPNLSLDRKSTMQVFDSMIFEPNDESPTVPFHINGFEDSATSLSKTTSGGIDASKSTVFSEVLESIEDNRDDHSESVKEETNGMEEDLAAKWKAALDGDEFLDDDDGFLEDDNDGATPQVDPATFFGSDDEGFLEDEDLDASFPSAKQEQTKSTPLPIADANGHVIGFNNIASNAQPAQSASRNRYLPAEATQLPSSQQLANPYAPPISPFTDLSTQSVPPANSYNTGYRPQSAQAFQTPPPKPEPPKAQSFVDKAKGGYTSPYDLPMDVTKPPKKRASMQQMAHGYANPPASMMPPQRSSSMFTQPPPAQAPPVAAARPPSSSSFQSTPPMSHALPVASKTAPPASKAESFFEELPIVAKPRPAHRPPSQPITPVMGSQPPFGGIAPPPQGHSAPPAQIFQSPSHELTAQTSAYDLVTPPQISPYASLPPPQDLKPAPMTSRYSPAPIQQNQHMAQPPLAQGRYATPPMQRPQIPSYSTIPSSNSYSHQPRTSSPLAHFEKSYDESSEVPDRVQNQRRIERRESLPQQDFGMPLSRSLSGQDMTSYHQSLGRHQGLQGQEHSNLSQQPIDESSVSSYGYQPNSSSPAKRAPFNYSPPEKITEHEELSFIPPRRSQTQSPSRAATGPRTSISMGEPFVRPSSVQSPTSPARSNHGYPSLGPTPHSPEAPKTRSRGFSQGLNYVAPTDGRQHDPLQRWKGAPVFAWGVGGSFITSFPKEVPRYAIGSSVPSVVRSPGEIKVRNIKDIYPMEEPLASFPGPLKGKSKKKEVIAWLSTGISLLEQQNLYLRSLSILTHDDKRKEERVLLWKLLRILVEHDGVMEGNPAVNAAVRAVLSPNLDSNSSDTIPHYATGAELSGIYKAAGSTTQAEPVDAAAVDELRKQLLRGDREKAVWTAVDHRLWAHAMLISHTLSPELYKQVAQEFIQKEVRNIGENTEPLAALYEVFAGNFEESVDELVPPSARAGYQMVSASAGSAPTKSAVDGLDRWRETLGLVLSNRSENDSQAIHSLGKLLSGYGRSEAAHICFVFARTHSLFAGIDDPNTNAVLIGSDHFRQPFQFDQDLEAILLTEVFEYGLSLSPSSHVPISVPHIAIYKLQHATILAELGQRDKSLEYCEAIATMITSQTRRSPYHHALLVSALDDLSKRLKQSPKDESSSWISKPSIDKVSGTVWAKFNKFVAGDENDAATAGGDAASEIGPFARIAGGTPTISRSPSIADMYGSHAGPPSGGLPVLGSNMSSRYAPGAAYTPQPQHQAPLGSSYGSQNGFGFGNAQFSPPRTRQSSSGGPDYGYPASNQEHNPTQGGNSPYAHQDSPQLQQGLYTATNQAYQPPGLGFSSPALAPSYEPQPAHHDSPRSSHGSEDAHSNDYEPSGSGYKGAASNYEPHVSNYEALSGGYGPPASGYEPPLSSYEPLQPSYEEPKSSYTPPEDGGYAPPSYEPATMDDELGSPVDTMPHKQGFIGDEHDDFKSAPSKEKTKAEKDREADEAFRKAAEADGKCFQDFKFTFLTCI
jgi:hypothetical protein